MVVVGLNHKTAPVGLLERLAVSADELPKALHQLATYEHVLEGVVLSTCNRIEVYAPVSSIPRRSPRHPQLLRRVLPRRTRGLHRSSVHVPRRRRGSSPFRVAAGIDSMVVGESEILGQVRRAYRAAKKKVSSTVFWRPCSGKLSGSARARHETAVGRNPVSISSAAVELAKRAFDGGTLIGKSVVIVGAGKMGAASRQTHWRLPARSRSSTVPRSGHRLSPRSWTSTPCRSSSCARPSREPTS